LKQLTVPRAIYHFLRWHTTVLKTTDFQYLGKDLPHQYFDTNRESLYDAISQFLLSGIRGELVSDRQGKLWAEPIPGAVLLPESYYDECLSLSKRDWMNSPNVIERISDDISYMEIGGIAWTDIQYGSGTSSSVPLIAAAPGIAPAYRGGVERFQGLILESQSGLNDLVGNLFANKNTPIRDMSVQLAGSYRNLDIAPIQRVSVIIEEGDTNKDIILTDDPFFISTMGFSYNAKDQHLLSRINLTQIRNGFRGETIEVPEIPPGYEVPPLPPFPPFPPFTIPEIITPDPAIPLSGVVATHIKGKGFWYTEDITATPVVWASWNDGLEFINIRDNVYAFMDLSHESGRGFLLAQGLNEIWTSPFPGEPWEILADNDFFDAYRLPAFGSFTTAVPLALIVNREDPDEILYIISQRFGSQFYEYQVFKGSAADGLTLTYRSEENIGKQIGMGVFGDSKWLVAWSAFSKIILRYPASATSLEYAALLDGSTGAATSVMMAKGGRGGTAALAWKAVPLQITEDNGDNFFTVTGTTPYAGGVTDWFTSVGVSYDGTKLLTFNGDGDLEYSYDKGRNWGDAALYGWTGTAGRAVENCGDVPGWLISGDSLVYYTDNDFSFFEDKTGNLGQLMSGTYETYNIKYMGG